MPPAVSFSWLRMSERCVGHPAPPGTTASPAIDRRPVAERDVQEDQGGRRPERGQQEGARRERSRRTGLDHGDQVLEQMHVVRGRGRETAVGDDAAGVGAAVVGPGLRARAADRGEAGGRHRLPGHREARAAELQTGLLGRAAETHGGARKRPQVRHAAGGEHVRHPARDRPWIVQRHVLHRGERPAGGEAHPPERPKAPAVARAAAPARTDPSGRTSGRPGPRTPRGGAWCPARARSRSPFARSSRPARRTRAGCSRRARESPPARTGPGFADPGCLPSSPTCAAGRPGWRARSDPR